MKNLKDEMTLEFPTIENIYKTLVDKMVKYVSDLYRQNTTLQNESNSDHNWY